jgi:hypothetical protein
MVRGTVDGARFRLCVADLSPRALSVAAESEILCQRRWYVRYVDMWQNPVVCFNFVTT